MGDERVEIQVKTGVVRWALVLLGLSLTALAVVGVFLPVLPTTPFLLLAATCFARSSPAMHRRLLANRVLGSYMSQWQRERTIPREARRKACGMVVLTFALSIALVDSMELRLMLGAVGGCLLLILSRLPTAPPDAEAGGP